MLGCSARDHFILPNEYKLYTTIAVPTIPTFGSTVGMNALTGAVGNTGGQSDSESDSSMLENSRPLRSRAMSRKSSTKAVIRKSKRIARRV